MDGGGDGRRLVIPTCPLPFPRSAVHRASMVAFRPADHRLLSDFCAFVAWRLSPHRSTLPLGRMHAPEGVLSEFSLAPSPRPVSFAIRRQVFLGEGWTVGDGAGTLLTAAGAGLFLLAKHKYTLRPRRTRQ